MNEYYYNIKAAALKGTEKQIKWAEKIREKLIEQVNEKSVKNIQYLFTTNTDKVKNFLNELKSLQTDNNNLNNQMIINCIRQLIASEENAKTFIENQSLLSFLKTILS
ncbi:MAG: hypothetical protein PHT02_00010 [Tissierellia bacterium]|nr:hypothetical protein [Tissierellia bacterium]